MLVFFAALSAANLERLLPIAVFLAAESAAKRLAKSPLVVLISPRTTTESLLKRFRLFVTCVCSPAAVVFFAMLSAAKRLRLFVVCVCNPAILVFFAALSAVNLDKMPAEFPLLRAINARLSEVDFVRTFFSWLFCEAILSAWSFKTTSRILSASLELVAKPIKFALSTALRKIQAFQEFRHR